jgi:hypothetical protein
MAASQATGLLEKVIGHGDNAAVTTDVSNYAKNEYGQETGARIKATTWQGKNNIKVGGFSRIVRSILPLSDIDGLNNSRNA